MKNKSKYLKKNKKTKKNSKRGGCQCSRKRNNIF